MRELHLPLILLGLCLLTLLALPELRRRFARRDRIPVLDHDPDDGDTEKDSGDAAIKEDGHNMSLQGNNADAVSEEQPDAEDNLLLLHIVARPGKAWSIGQVAATLETAGLFLGDMDIFHYPDPAERSAALFSVANINEPGTLNPADTQMPVISGLVVFRRLSADARDARAFACMLRAGKACCHSLGAILCDSNMNTMGETEIGYMRRRFISAPGARRTGARRD